MVYAIVIPAAVSLATLPLALASGIVSTIGDKALPSEPQEPIVPGFLPFISPPPNIDIGEQLPTTEPPHKRAVDQVVLIPEQILSSLPRPNEFLQSLRSTDSPAEVLRDIEGPFEIIMSLPGPHRELPNPIADIYFLRQSILWIMWDGRTLWGSGFDNFIRNDIPVMRNAVNTSLYSARDTVSSLRDTNVELRRKMLPVAQDNLTNRIPRTQVRVDKALDAVAKMLDGMGGGPLGFLGSLF